MLRGPKFISSLSILIFIRFTNLLNLANFQRFIKPGVSWGGELCLALVVFLFLNYDFIYVASSLACNFAVSKYRVFLALYVLV